MQDELPFKERIKTLSFQPAGGTKPTVTVDRKADTKTVEVITESGDRLGGRHVHHGNGSIDAHVVAPTVVADFSGGTLN